MSTAEETSNPSSLGDGVALLNRREAEQKRILLLKQRLATIKEDSSRERSSRAELVEIQKKCEELLTEATCLANGAEVTIRESGQEVAGLVAQVQLLETSRAELDVLRQELETKLQEATLRKEELPTASLEAQLDKERRKAECLKEELELFRTLANSLQEEKSLTETKRLLGLPEESAHDSEKDLQLKFQNGMLLSHLKFLQTTFESDVALARSLYTNLGADVIPSPNRCGYLTKQGKRSLR